MRSLRNHMRWLAAGAPALIASTLTCAAACDTPPEQVPMLFVGGTASAGASAPFAAGTLSNGGAGGAMPTLQINFPSGGSGAEPSCDLMVTELGADPVPDLAQICASEVEPISSNGAVRLSLESDPREPSRRALGKLTLQPQIRESVLGAPVMIVIGARGATLLPVSLSELEPGEPGEYRFTIDWPEAAQLVGDDETRVTFRSSFDVTCEGGDRLVSAFTELHLCGGDAGHPLTWAGPGDNCAACRRIGGERKR